jgi:hypothetical protein
MQMNWNPFKRIRRAAYARKYYAEKAAGDAK